MKYVMDKPILQLKKQLTLWLQENPYYNDTEFLRKTYG